MSVYFGERTGRLQIKYKLESGAYPPEKAHSADAGFDLRTPVDFTLPARGSAVIDTGVHVQIPHGYVGFLKSKSGLNIKFSLLSGEGVIDAEYTGTITVKCYNHTDDSMGFERGDKISQLVILPIPDVEMVEGEMDDTERGENGFGSTGR